MPSSKNELCNMNLADFSWFMRHRAQIPKYNDDRKVVPVFPQFLIAHSFKKVRKKWKKSRDKILLFC